MEKIADHTQWILWQRAMALASDLHVVTQVSTLEVRDDLYGDLRRTSVALASHIAEAGACPNRHDRSRALGAARSLLVHLEVQIHVCMRLNLLTGSELTSAISSLIRLLDKEIQVLREQPSRDSRCIAVRTIARAHSESIQAID